MKNIRISINDLISACRVIGEVRVMAAGSLYATLEVDDVACRQLTKANISWALDL